MGRFSGKNSCDFLVKRMGADWYRLMWTVDYYYPASRLRHPRAFSRDTDEAGAIRFCKRHGCEMPDTQANGAVEPLAKPIGSDR